mgnify:CR=1 FL=1
MGNRLASGVVFAAMMQSDSPFAGGIVISPVTDLLNYNPIRITRYMDRNGVTAGYKTNQAIGNVKSIKGKLLLVHAMNDGDNPVENTNKLVRDTPFKDNKSLENIILHADGPLYNNAAQAWNHDFYWHCFAANGGGMPHGKLAERIDKCFGSFDEFKTKFAIAATSLFGSGWIWLVENGDGTLEIFPTANADNPLRYGRNPILTCDVWEHAYYLDYQNRRADSLNSLWDIIDWSVIGSRF